MLPSRRGLELKRAFVLADGIETFKDSMDTTKCRDRAKSYGHSLGSAGMRAVSDEVARHYDFTSPIIQR